MKADKIHISNFQFLSVKQLEINRAIGEHATAAIGGYIADDNAEEYREKVLKHIWVTITAEDEGEEDKILMTGIIAGFSFESHPHASFMTLVLKSGTYLMDGITHFRSFQNTGMSYLDIMNFINGFYGKAGVKGEECLGTASCDFLLQYKETDWTFLKRIASHFGLSVTPGVVNEGIFYQVGKANSFTYSDLSIEQLNINKNVDDFMVDGANGRGTLFEQDYLEYHVTMRGIFDLWEELIIGNMRGYICRIHSKYEHEELIHTYVLRPLKGLAALRLSNQFQSGCSFLATVKEVAQDLVKIVLNGDENTGQEITRWFSYSTGYSTPDGSGWYCMPEIGDQVRLQIPGEFENEGYVISSVHKKTENARQNPDHKSFKTKYGKELLFTPTSLEMTNNQGMSIKITDEEGISIASSKDISITAGGSMTISSEDASLVIAGTESVDVRQGGAGLHMEDDVAFTGGKFRIQ